MGENWSPLCAEDAAIDTQRTLRQTDSCYTVSDLRLRRSELYLARDAPLDTLCPRT